MKHQIKLLLFLLLSTNIFAQQNSENVKEQQTTVQNEFMSSQVAIIKSDNMHEQKVVTFADHAKAAKEGNPDNNEKEIGKSNKKLWYIISGAAILGGTIAVILLKDSGKKDNRIPEPYLPPLD